MATTILPRKNPDFSLQTHSEDETLRLSKSLAKILKPGDWLALMGELGTGKTVFTKGVGQALGCQELPTSPTFVLMQAYPARIQGKKISLNHVDLYRLAPEEIPHLSWDELYDEKQVTIVEWAEKARPYWPSSTLVVRLGHEGGSQRRIDFFALDKRGADIIGKVKKFK